VREGSWLVYALPDGELLQVPADSLHFQLASNRLFLDYMAEPAGELPPFATTGHNFHGLKTFILKVR